jgi:hypothetical protein
MANIFISYSSEDKTLVRKLASLLEQKGWTVWWDRQIPIGQHFDSVIESELNKADCVLVIWTHRAVASAWVRNEASAAAAQKKLVPVMIEQVEVPLAFRLMEAAMMIGWNGEPVHPELDLLYHAIEGHVQQKGDNNGETPTTPITKPEEKDAGDGKAGYKGRLSSKMKKQVTIWSLAVFGLVLIAILYARYTATDRSEKNVVIRVFDWKKNPLQAGDVKLYLNEYIRTQSIDRMGQAVFTGVPQHLLREAVKLEVSSPGYTTRTFDTLLSNSGSTDITIPYTTEIVISGRVKTAAEVPIKGVELNIDGTRYYALSITDGTYQLRLDEYTLGDEITITTSHPKYEDKTIAIRISAPELNNQDIFLNPVSP